MLHIHARQDVIGAPTILPQLRRPLCVDAVALHQPELAPQVVCPQVGHAKLLRYVQPNLQQRELELSSCARGRGWALPLYLLDAVLAAPFPPDGVVDAVLVHPAQAPHTHMQP
jgi:hypothetical protein